MRFAVVVSRFNERINEGLLDGARATLAEAGYALANEDLIYSPGAFEMPLLAKNLAETGRYDGVICLGSVIKGDTAHFEFISLGAAIGIQQASLLTDVPIAFGILTTYSMDQALVRSAPDAHNKGREAASACLASAQALAKIRE